MRQFHLIDDIYTLYQTICGNRKVGKVVRLFVTTEQNSSKIPYEKWKVKYCCFALLGLTCFLYIFGWFKKMLCKNIESKNKDKQVGPTPDSNSNLKCILVSRLDPSWLDQSWIACPDLTFWIDLSFLDLPLLDLSLLYMSLLYLFDMSWPVPHWLDLPYLNLT